MSTTSLDDYKALLHEDFATFAHRAFLELYPTTPFLPNWHVEAVAAALESLRHGKILRLGLYLPPRHLKSFMASVAFPAFWLGHDPTAQIMCVSYGQDLAQKHSLDCRRLMRTPFYRSVFGTRLSPLKQAAQQFDTTAGGFRLAMSISGAVTGRGADAIIIDDPIKPADAQSEAIRRSTNDAYDNTIYSRLNDKRTGRIALVTQRTHLDDLVGHVRAQEPWTELSFPAIAEVDELHVIETPYGPYRHVRRAGEALHAAREPVEVLQQLRRTLGEYEYASQYQQSPVPLDGGIVKRAWLKFYDAHEKPDTFEQIIQSWDTASKAGTGNDYSVCTTWGRNAGGVFLLDVFRKRLDFPDLKRAVRDRLQAFNATVVLIEEAGSGVQLLQDLTHEGIYILKGVKPEGDKATRLYNQTDMFENGIVRLPREAVWLGDYVSELLNFGRTPHDDQVDSTSQALCWIKQSAIEPGFFAYMRADCAQRGVPFPG